MNSIKLGLIILVALNSCKTKSPDDAKTYNRTFEIGQIPSIDNFDRLDKRELSIDSVFSDKESIFDSMFSKIDEPDSNSSFKNDFIHNRSRIYMDSDPNHKLFPGDKDLDKGFPTPCNCVTNGDTLFITMGLGLFGGAGFSIKLFKENFISNFFIYTDDVKPYKSHLSDTAFADNAIADNKFQYLIIDKKPTYESNQQLTGYLTYTSNRFYEINTDNGLDSSYVTGKIYFTCLTNRLQDTNRTR